MSLANFFDKAALAASQALHGVDHAALVSVLEAGTVGVSFDEAAVGSMEGVWTLELSVNLLARLYPRIALAPRGQKAVEFAESLVVQARSVNPELEIREDPHGVRAWLTVGETAFPTSSPVFYLGSDGWLARLSGEAPVGSGNSHNPFGAGVAACFGAANLFRLCFGEHLPGAQLDETLTLSLFSFQQVASDGWNPELPAVDLGESHLVGVGAIGNGAVWALSKLESLQGTLHLIDGEAIDLSNLQRYVLTEQSHVAAFKVELAAEALAHTGLTVVPHAQHWPQYVASRDRWEFQRVAVATDSARSRWEVQAALPRWLVNAWTQVGDIGVSRHTFVGEDACLLCLYLPDQPQPSEDQLVADAIGLPDAVVDVRQLLYTNAPVGEDWICRIAEALSIPAEPLLKFADQPIRKFYSEAICGGVVLRLGGSVGKAEPVQAPLAFQSALAGIMLGAELVAHASGLRHAPSPVMTRINLLAPLGEHLSFPHRKHPSGRCICQDADYVAAYQSKYAVAGTA